MTPALPEKIHVGNLIVCRGTPPQMNPRVAKRDGCEVFGEERLKALARFKNNKNTDGYTFWYVPQHGTVARIMLPRLVAWGEAKSVMRVAEAEVLKQMELAFS